MTEEIVASRVDQDGELLMAARSLLEKLNEQPAAQRGIQQTVAGNQNVFSVTGDITVHR